MRRSFVWSLGTPDRADLFGAPVFLSSQGEIRVLARKTTREFIEATCRFPATSRVRSHEHELPRRRTGPTLVSSPVFQLTAITPPPRRGGDRLLRRLDNSLVACQQRDVTPSAAQRAGRPP